MKIRNFLLLTMAFSAMGVDAQVKLDVDASQPGIAISPNLYGIFFEDINHAADGGLYAELIRNRSFEDNEKTPEFWDAFHGAQLKLQTMKLLNTAQKQALEVSFTGNGVSGFGN